MRNYIFNLETTKIELHFEKSEYVALPEEKKKALKGAFLWSNRNGCWVSRAKEPNLYWAKRVAKDLGFEEEQREGERLSFGEQIERKQERAEDRACRFEQYAINAEKKAAALQKPLNAMHGDIAFFTQPIIAGHAGSQAFARRRERMFNQYEKGFAEYRKSEYFNSRADTARETASGGKYNDKAYLDRQIKDAQKEIRKRQSYVVEYEDKLYKIEDEQDDGSLEKKKTLSEYIERELELIGVAMDKEAWLQNKLDSLGGVMFNAGNIDVGMVIKVQRWGLAEVIGKGRVNITFKILEGGAAGGRLQAAYAEILSVEKEAPKVLKTHPFNVGDSFTCHEWSDVERKAISHTFTIVKATDKSVTLQDENGDKRNRKPKERPWAQEKGLWALAITNWNDGLVYKKEVV